MLARIISIPAILLIGSAAVAGTPICYTDGGTQNQYQASNRFRGNMYRFEQNVRLDTFSMEMEHFNQAELNFLLIAADRRNVEANVIHYNIVDLDMNGRQHYNSGTVGAKLLPHRYYVIGVGWRPQTSLSYFSNSEGSYPVMENYGIIETGWGVNNFFTSAELNAQFFTDRFSLIHCYEQVSSNAYGFGDFDQGEKGPSLLRGNILSVDSTRTLTRMEFYIENSAATNVTFHVFESNSANGSYREIFQRSVSAPAGEGWVDAPAMETSLNQGNFYLVAVSWGDEEVTVYRAGEQIPNSFPAGQVQGAALVNGFDGNLPGSITPEPFEYVSVVYFDEVESDYLAKVLDFPSSGNPIDRNSDGIIDSADVYLAARE